MYWTNSAFPSSPPDIKSCSLPSRVSIPAVWPRISAKTNRAARNTDCWMGLSCLWEHKLSTAVVARGHRLVGATWSDVLWGERRAKTKKINAESCGNIFKRKMGEDLFLRKNKNQELLGREKFDIGPSKRYWKIHSYSFRETGKIRTASEKNLWMWFSRK